VVFAIAMPMALVCLSIMFAKLAYDYIAFLKKDAITRDALSRMRENTEYDILERRQNNR